MAWFIAVACFPITRSITGLAAALIAFYGAKSVLAGSIDAGAWYLFVLSTDRFLMPVLNMTNYWTIVQTGLSAAERIFALIDAQHSVKQTAQLLPKTWKPVSILTTFHSPIITALRC